MPFRQSKAVRELLTQYRRGGEPSPALYDRIALYDSICSLRDGGQGKSQGSFTRRLNEALQSWLKERGSVREPISFSYRLSRHRRVTITGTQPHISHNPLNSSGRKGFILNITIGSIDGIAHKGMRRVQLAWDRIEGRERLLGLPAPVEWIGQVPMPMGV